MIQSGAAVREVRTAIDQKYQAQYGVGTATPRPPDEATTR